MGITVYRTRCAFLGAALFLLAAALLVAGYFLPVEITKALNRGIAGQVIVDSPNATGYADWQNTGLPDQPLTYMKFHVFNITNYEEYIAGAPPNVVDIGPYSYLETRVKVNVSFLDDGDQVQYWLWEYFIYDQTTTGVNPTTGLPLDPCTDVVYSAYTAYQAVQANLGSSWWASLAFSTIASNVGVGLVKRVPVQELIWGTDCAGNPVADPLLKVVAKLQPGTPTSVPLQVNLTDEEETLATTGFSQQYTGKKNISQVHSYLMWNSAPEVTVWATPEANRVQGTDGYNFPPGLTKEDNITVWIDVLQRAGHLLVNTTLNETITSIEGIKCLWYTVNQEDFGPNPDFYTEGPIGILNFTSASNGAPVFISKPHFLDADYYLTLVTGLSPNRTLHDTNVFVEPISGIMMESQKRLQINLLINPSILYPAVPTAYIPVVWIEESGGITPSLAKQFRSQVYGAQKVRSILMWIGIFAGSLFVLCGLAIFLAILAPDRTPVADERTGEVEPLLKDTTPGFLTS